MTYRKIDDEFGFDWNREMRNGGLVWIELIDVAPTIMMMVIINDNDNNKRKKEFLRFV